MRQFGEISTPFLEASKLRLSTGVTAGYIATADANGLMSWQAAPASMAIGGTIGNSPSVNDVLFVGFGGVLDQDDQFAYDPNSGVLSVPNIATTAGDIDGVLFIGSNGIMGTSPAFVFDGSDERLGIGTSSLSGKLSIYGGLLNTMTDVPIIDGSVEWGNGGATYTGWKMNVVDGASDAASLLLDLQVDSTSKFTVRKDGLTTGSAFSAAVGSASAPGHTFTGATNYGLFANTGSEFTAVTANGKDVGLADSAANAWRPGADITYSLGRVDIRWVDAHLSGQVKWGTGAAVDTGITRDSAGVVKVTDGSTGLGDLIVGNVSLGATGTQGTITSLYTGGPLKFVSNVSSTGGTDVGFDFLVDEDPFSASDILVRFRDTEGNIVWIDGGGGLWVIGVRDSQADSFYFASNFGLGWRNTNMHFHQGAANTIRWDSNNDGLHGTPDTGLARGSAGVLKSTDGSTGRGQLDTDLYTIASITASTTQTQGQGALTATVNEVSVCANTNDTVTLPAATAGRECLVINNGAETMQVFPASGDDLGQGTDTATTIATGAYRRFVAYSASNWIEA